MQQQTELKGKQKTERGCIPLDRRAVILIKKTFSMNKKDYTPNFNNTGIAYDWDVHKESEHETLFQQ